jgi:hypothetical protein
LTFGQPIVNLRMKMVLSAAVAFGVSLFLPALDHESGYLCLVDCWRIFARSDSGHTLPMGDWLYYSGFVAANALFIPLLCATWFSPAFPRVRIGISLVLVLQVFSWLIVSLFHVDKEDDFGLRVGYFLWLFSFILLLAAHIVRKDEHQR